MATLQMVTLLMAVWLCLSCAKPPPGFAKKPENIVTPPKYEFGYSVSDGGGGAQGHLESREGELARGMFFVRLPSSKDGNKEATQEVKYLADDWGFHPLVQYRSASPHGATSTSFALGGRAVAALRKQLQQEEAGSSRDATDSALSTIEAVSKTLKAQASISNAVGEQLQVFGSKASAPSAPLALPLVSPATDEDQQLPSSGAQEYSHEVEGVRTTDYQANAQQPVYVSSDTDAKLQTTVVQPVSNLLVQLPQVTYQTSFDASGSAITYTQVPDADRARLYSSQSGHYHYITGTSTLPTSQQALGLQEEKQENGGATSASYTHNDVIETSTAATSSEDSSVRVSYHKEASSSSTSFTQDTQHVSSTSAPSTVQVQPTSKPDIENYPEEEFLASGSSVTPRPGVSPSYSAIAEQQLVTTLDPSRYSFKGNGSPEGSATRGYTSYYGSVTPALRPVAEQVSYVTATAGESQYASGLGYGQEAFQNQVQEEERSGVQVTAYGSPSNAAASLSSLEFGAKIRPSQRAKPISSHKQALRLNEVQFAQESLVQSATRAPPPRPSLRPIVVAELSDSVEVVTPSPALVSEASNAVASTSTVTTASSSSSIASSISPVVVTPQPALLPAPSVTHDQREVLITPRPDTSVSSAKETGGRISATLPQVSRTSTSFRRQFKSKNGVHSRKTTAPSPTPSTTSAEEPSSESSVTEKPEDSRAKTIVEIQKAIPYEFPVESVYAENIDRNPRPVFIPQSQISTNDEAQTIVYPSPQQASVSQNSDVRLQQADDSLYKTISAQQPELKTSGSQQTDSHAGKSQTSELTGSQLLLATLLEDHEGPNQEQEYTKPQLIQFRPQSDILNSEFLNQIQIASAQSLLQAIQYETLRTRESKQLKNIDDQKSEGEGEKLPVPLPLVSYVGSEQQSLQQDNKPLKADIFRVESALNNEEVYEPEADDTTIFDIAKKVKQDQDLQVFTAHGKKSHIQSLLESEKDSGKRQPQIEVSVSDKEIYTNEQLTNLQKEIQAGYQQYFDNISKQVAQSQQYFGMIAKQPISFGQEHPQVDLQLVNIQGQQELLQVPDRKQAQEQGHKQVHQQDKGVTVQDQVTQVTEQQQIQSQEQRLENRHEDPPTRVELQQQIQPYQAQQFEQQQQLQKQQVNGALQQQLLGSESQTHAIITSQQLGKPLILKHVDSNKGLDIKQASERPLSAPQPIAVPVPQALPVSYAVPHIVAVPHFVQVPLKEYHPVFVPKNVKVGHSGHAALSHPSPHPPPPPPPVYNYPHKDNLHRALLKQHGGDAASYGLGRYAGTVVRRPTFPSPLLHHHPHLSPYRGPPRRPQPPLPPPPQPQRGSGQHRGKLRHLVIEYGGFRPPLVPSKQIDEDPSLDVRPEAKSD